MDADVVVLGAGAAGLAAAGALARDALQVVLLEARDRTGGRVWSRALAGAATPAELGAEFIHGPAETTMRLLGEAGLGIVGVGGDSWTYRNGRLRRDDDDFTAASAILERAATLDGDESVARFLQRFERDATMRDAAEGARGFVEGFEAADPAIASAHAIALELRSGADSTRARPRGGYAPLFRHLHDVCVAAGVSVCLNATVQRIHWRPHAVTVDAVGRDGAPVTVRARTAVVTLPAGVLSQRGGACEIAFDPELPAGKRQALANVAMGHVVKVVLEFRTAFWERLDGGKYRAAAFFRSPAQAFAAYWTQMPKRERSIVAWVGGPKAEAFAGAAEAERIECAVAGFGALFDAPELARSELESGAVHDWSDDPFTRGAYSYVAVGGGDARAVLAAPVDDALFFAGEATSTDGQGGTVSGALETGERAAREAASSLRRSLRPRASRG